MMNSINLDYMGFRIPFSIESSSNSVMVNATEMAKVENKLVADFLRLKSTTNFINALINIMGVPRSQILVVIRGGGPQTRQGTWMCEALAIEFAKWLNPMFGVWCSVKISELVKKGHTDIYNNYLADKPYADYAKAMLSVSTLTYSTTELLKGFKAKISTRDFIKRCKTEKIIEKKFKSRGMWHLNKPYDKFNYTTLVSSFKNGTWKNRIRWTEAGRRFVFLLLVKWRAV